MDGYSIYFIIWSFIGLFIVLYFLIKMIDYIYLIKENKIREKYRKIDYYSGEIYFSKDKKIKYRILEENKE